MPPVVYRPSSLCYFCQDTDQDLLVNSNRKLKLEWGWNNRECMWVNSPGSGLVHTRLESVSWTLESILCLSVPLCSLGPGIPSTDERIKLCVCIHTMEYICSNMGAESFILSEVSQKNKYYMISLMCESLNTTPMNLSMKQKQIHRQENGPVTTEGKGGSLESTGANYCT